MSITLQLDHYLSVRRSLGYDLRTDERVLRRFARFADQEAALHVNTKLFLKWDASLSGASSSTRAARLGKIRLFVQWLSGMNPIHEVPPRGLLPNRYRRVSPYIYSETEIASIISTATTLPSIYGIRGRTYAALFGLIAITGLRISEALALDREDLDFESVVLRVRHGKLGKERFLPLDATAVMELANYANERDRLLGCLPEAFFVNCKGKRLSDCNARYHFALICQQIGMRTQQRYCRHGKGPRIHDLRHTFAVRTMINWYRAGKDPAHEMIQLTTYLGHADPDNTYWYLQAVPELLELAMAHATSKSKELNP